MATASVRPDVPALPDDLPATWVARRPTPADAPALHALCRACDEAVLGVSDVSQADVEADLVRPGADPTTNQLVVVDGSRALVWVLLDDHGPGDVRADLYVDRDLPTATADALAGWAWDSLLARAVTVTAAHGRPDADVDVAGIDGDAVAERWLGDRRFHRARTFWRMRRDVAPDETPPPRPRGLVVRRVDAASEDDLRLIHRVHEDAFADHWNFHPRDFATWWGQMRSSAGLDLALWWLAEVDGEPGGLLIATTQMEAEDALYVDSLGTVPTARRRGVAVTLLREAFAEAARRGLAGVALNVDSENATGATQLYESAGMRVEFKIHQWRRRLDVAATG